MIPVAEAIRLICEGKPAREVMWLPVTKAAGHTLAQDVSAKLSKPPEPVSAMDGYAVRLADVQKERASLEVIGNAPAGAPFGGTVGIGEAVRIFTGGVIPEGADHIVIQENVERHDQTIICKKSYKEALHIRKLGLDFSEGDIILRAGRRLSALDVALAAAANHDEIPVYQPLLVSLLSNGDELKPPGSYLAPGEIISANSIGIGALVEEWGGEAVDLGIAPDNLEAIEQKIKDVPSTSKVIVAIGGASVGDHDYMRRAFSNAGFDTIFEKIAVRPGKPTWLAKRGDQVVLGLPGNPASALVCAHLFLRPLINASEYQHAVLSKTTASIVQNGPRETYMRAKAEIGYDATLQVTPLSNQDSSLLTPLSNANCFIRRAPNQEATERGELVETLMIQSICS